MALVPAVPRLAVAQADDLLQSLLSHDGRRIVDASRTVAHTFDVTLLDALAPHADRIERSCAGIALGGAMVSLQAHLDFALRRLRHWHAQAGCLCTLNPAYPFFNPRPLIEQRHMQLLALEQAADGWGDCHHVACTQCGRRWQATDREYHYPWWEWKSAA